MAATPAEAVYAVLQADATLAAIATGGGYLVDKLTTGGDKHPINPEDTPSAYSVANSVSRLLPCYTVMTQGRGPAGGRRTFSTRVEVRMYQRAGYDKTRAMMDRVYRLLAGAGGEGTVLTLTGGRQYEVMHVNDLTSSMDDSLQAGQGKRSASMEAALFDCVGGVPA